jgi:hypothetical protein
MTAKTKYSRSTWKKKQLQQSMNTPRLGNSACSLCADRSIPQNLNAHVSDSQTCADVHLQLALLRYDNAMCSVGQQQYQEVCCPKKESNHVLRSSLGFLAGIFLVGFFVKKLSASQRSGRASRDDDSNGSKKGKDLLMTHQSISSSSGSGSNSSNVGSHRSKGSSELEMPTASYQNMDSLAMMTMKRSTTNPSRSQSRSRPQSRSRSRGRPDGRATSRPKSRPRARSQSRTMIMAEALSRGDSIKRSSSRVAPDSRHRSVSRGRNDQNLSRSRSKSRDRRRAHQDRAPSNREDQYKHHYRSTGLIVEYNINPYHQHEEVEVSSGAGLILPTQVV